LLASRANALDCIGFGGFGGVRASTLKVETNSASLTLGKSRETFSVIEPAGATRRRSGDIQSGRNGFFEVIETEVRTNRVIYTLTPELLP
jgi:hypothetical protein